MSVAKRWHHQFRSPNKNPVTVPEFYPEYTQRLAASTEKPPVLVVAVGWRLLVLNALRHQRKNHIGLFQSCFVNAVLLNALRHPQKNPLRNTASRIFAAGVR